MAQDYHCSNCGWISSDEVDTKTEKVKGNITADKEYHDFCGERVTPEDEY